MNCLILNPYLASLPRHIYTRSQLWFPKESCFPKSVTNIYIYEGNSEETIVFHRPGIKSIHLKLLRDDIVILFHVKGVLRIFVLENCLWGFYFCESKGIVGVESASCAGWSHESFKMNCWSFKEELLVVIVKKLYLHPSHFESNCLLYVAVNANCIPGANVTGYLLSLKVWSGKFNMSAFFWCIWQFSTCLHNSEADLDNILFLSILA